MLFGRRTYQTAHKHRQGINREGNSKLKGNAERERHRERERTGKALGGETMEIISHEFSNFAFNPKTFQSQAISSWVILGINCTFLSLFGWDLKQEMQTSY